jgi:hypothetical protein
MSTALATKAQYPEEVLLSKADDLGLQVAILDRRLIKAAGRQPIMELPERERVERVGVLLKGVFRDLGIKGEPERYDGARLLGYLELNHPKFTTSDVKEAFELFLSGRLAQDLPERHDHYQQFSVAFYARVFKAYASMQAHARYTVRNKVMNKQQALAAPSMPPEVCAIRSLEIIRAEVSAALSSGNVRFSLPGFTFDTMVRLGIVSPVQPPTEEELQAASLRLKVRKGAAHAHTWMMQRILAGEKVDDVEWEALTEKKMRHLVASLNNLGHLAVDRLTDELDRMKEKATAKGYKIED